MAYNFPTFKRFLSEPTEKHWHTPMTVPQLKRLDEALLVWSEAMDRGSIENPRFVETKETISRAFEVAWSALPRDNDYMRALSEKDANALDSLPSPNLANLMGRRARVSKAPLSPLRTSLLELLDELKPLADAYTFLRANSVKRKIKTDEERAEDRFTPPPSSSEAVAAVRFILETAIDRTYESMVARLKAINRNLIGLYLEAQTKAMEDPELAKKGYSPRTHYTVPGRRGGGMVSNPGACSFLYRVLEVAPGRLSYQSVYNAPSSTYEKSDALAIDDANLIKKQFLFKNLAKLTPILEAKGDRAFKLMCEIGQFNLSTMEGEFEVQFNDNSSFRIKNGVVFVVNQHSTQFYRFPTTFHDVIMPDGKPMPQPSEERMNLVFAVPPVAGVEKEVSSPRKSRPR